MTTLLLASANPGKLSELQTLLTPLDFTVITPQKAGIPSSFDPPETGTTFAQNALIKAKAYALKAKLPAIADDSGLVVDALDGRPGVYSKRYGRTDQSRNQKLLKELASVTHPHRTARFVCAICYFNPQKNQTLTATGVVEGKIASKIRGQQGFGYDPIFIPAEIPGSQTFGQLGPTIKNRISHRARALKILKQQLSGLQSQ